MKHLPPNNLPVVSDDYKPLEKQSLPKSEQTESKTDFSEKEIVTVTKFAETLKKIHIRLISEGYKIKGGKITPPEKKYN